MSDASITKRSAQGGDGINALLARLVGSPIRGTLLPSASRNTTTSSAELDLAGFRGVIVYWNITAASGTGGLFVFPEHQDPITGLWARCWNYPLAARTSTGFYIVQCGPGIGTQYGGSFSALGIFSTLLGKMRFTISHVDTSPYTYSLGYELL